MDTPGKFLGTPGLRSLRFDDQVPFLDQPVVELVGRMQAVGSANRPDLFIPGRFLHFLVQEQLDGAFHILAVFPALVFGIPISQCHT